LCAEGHYNIVKLAKLDKISKDRINLAFIEACVYGHSKVAELLIKHGADAWTEGFTQAMYHGHIDILKLIIQNTNIAITQNSFNIGLYTACRLGRFDIALLMCENGANRIGTPHHSFYNMNCKLNAHEMLFISEKYDIDFTVVPDFSTEMITYINDTAHNLASIVPVDLVETCLLYAFRLQIC
jgi:hypothetical protein